MAPAGRSQCGLAALVAFGPRAYDRLLQRLSLTDTQVACIGDDTPGVPLFVRVALAVADLERSIRYYEDIIGLTLLERTGDMARLGAGENGFLLLTGQPGARPVQPTTSLSACQSRPVASSP